MPDNSFRKLKPRPRMQQNVFKMLQARSRILPFKPIKQHVVNRI